MPGLTQARQVIVLDLAFPIGSNGWMAVSINGTSQWSGMGRGQFTFGAATNATPSVKGNNGWFQSPQATAAGVVSHTSIWDAASGGNQITDWTPLIIGGVVATRQVFIGDRLSWSFNQARITLD